MKRKEILTIFVLALLVTGMLFLGGYRLTLSISNIFTWVLVLGISFLGQRLLKLALGKSGSSLLQKLISLLFFIVLAVFVLALLISVFIPAPKAPSEYGLTSITVSWKEGGILTQSERFNFIKDLDWSKSTKDWKGNSYFVTNTRKELREGKYWVDLHGTWLNKDGAEAYWEDFYLIYPTLASCGGKLCIFGLEKEHFTSKKWWYKIPGFGDLWWGLNPALQPTGPEVEFIISVFPDEKGYLIDNNPCSGRAIDSFRVLEEKGAIQVELLCKDSKLYKSLFDIWSFH